MQPPAMQPIVDEFVEEPIPSESGEGSGDGGEHDSGDDNGDPVPDDSGDVVDFGFEDCEDSEDEACLHVVEREAAKRQVVLRPEVVATKGTWPRPDLQALYGREFSELWPAGQRKGLAMACPQCGSWKHLTTCYIVLSEPQAVRRLYHWGQECPGDPSEHRRMGKSLLVDYVLADTIEEATMHVG